MYCTTMYIAHIVAFLEIEGFPCFFTVLRIRIADQDPVFNFDVDSDPVFNFGADPDQTFHFNADPYLTF